MSKYTQIPKPNLKDAKEYSLRIMFATVDDFYGSYSPMPITTNELVQIYNLENHVKPGAKVLTVSGSGEQPIFFKLYGAGQVITFDISYNSYLLQSLKIAALQTFDKNKDYEQFIRDLGQYSGYGYKYLTDTPHIDSVMQYLTDEQRTYIRYTDRLGCPVFMGEYSYSFYSIPQGRYENLRQSLKSPFPFIWTDITDLNKKLGRDTFDIIYYSNILSFVRPYNIRPVLEKTKKHLNQDGKLFLMLDDEFEVVKSAIDDVFDDKDWDIKVLPENQFFNETIIQRKQHMK